MASLGHGPHEQHGVVFYAKDDEFLCEAIVDFCVRALRAGDPLLVIATISHLRDLRVRLIELGVDWDRACTAGTAAGFDAAELLRSFSTPVGLNPFRFRSAMDRVLGPFVERNGGRPVRAFGEMVDLLCRKGDIAGAAQLEEMWNELARTHRFTLLCAYSMANLFREVNGSAYRRIVDAHDHLVAPSSFDELPAGPQISR